MSLQVLSEPAGVRVWCPGRPRTKGSLKPVHIRMGGGRCRVSLTESGEYAVAWKEAMIAAVRAVCECSRWAEPVEVHTFFRFERLTVGERVEVDRESGGVVWPVRAKGEFAHGDEDKLRRNCLDALTQSGLILDDALVVGGQNWKRYCEPDEESGVMIFVQSVSPEWSVRSLERVWGRFHNVREAS